MSYEINVAIRYRRAAEQLRGIASDDTDFKTSDILKRVADEYERTAENLEALERLHMRHDHSHPPAAP